MFEWIQTNAASINVIAALLLVSVTGFYAYLTWGILRATEKQSKLGLAPVLGIKVVEGGIGPVFGPNRRNMSFDLEITNVGNAPAIEVLVDAEITFRHTSIENRKTIPARFEPDVIPFVQPGETNRECDPNFGNLAIAHFFEDVQESIRLNMDRIKTDPTKEAFDASRLKVVCYYRNSLAQTFRSYFETEIDLQGEGQEDQLEPFPADGESKEVWLRPLPRPKFHSGPITHKEMQAELENRNSIRKLSGW